MSMPYNPALDGIRALAAITVAAIHARAPGLTAGFFGVDVFFVLSGYLITRLLWLEHQATHAVDWRSFMRRRWARLWPALVVFLLVYLAVAPWLWPSIPLAKHMQDAGLTAVYVVNWSPSWGGGVSVLGHVWSLAVEMQFYAVWPLLFVLLMKLPRRTLLPSLLVLYVASTAWRWWGAEHLPRLWDVYVRTDMHCSGLLLGCMLGVWNRRLPQAWAWPGLVILGLAMTFFSSAWLPTAQYGFTVAELGAAMLLMARPPWLGVPWLAWVGRMSYGLYLWHYLIMVNLRDKQDADWRITLLIGLAGGLVAATISHHLIERRFHRSAFERAAPVMG